jgi:hypothetical protein
MAEDIAEITEIKSNKYKKRREKKGRSYDR